MTNFVQFSIFDLPLPPAPEPAKEKIVAPTSEINEPITSKEFDFDCTVPGKPNKSGILGIGDKVVIIPAKYGHISNFPGVVKTFLPTGIVVRRKDGEGLYDRDELHKV